MTTLQRPKFDVGIVVPLREEFRYVIEIAPQIEAVSHQGTYFYRLDFGATSAVCCLIDQMGPLPALQATTRLLEFADVKLIVVLGLGGALDKGIAIGDVVVGAEINEFQASSKAEPAGNGYEVRYSGRHWPLQFQIRESISHFEFSGYDAFARWRTVASNDYNALEVSNKADICSSAPSLHLGPIASGSVVAASSAFVAEVKRINRKFLAIDMEAAGVAHAAAERIHSIPCLVVRGISDPANESKKVLDEEGKGVWRRYSVRNATSFLRNLLTWDGFLNAADLCASAPILSEDGIAKELAARLKSHVGGPWIVGAAFGIYSHGPRVGEGDNSVPMDLNRLRVLDPRIRDLLDAADTLKYDLLTHGDLEKGAGDFATLIEQFRNQLNLASADSLLRDFDRVVTETLSPAIENERLESILLQSDRLEEDIGLDAVLQFLKGLLSVHERVRERYIDALAASNKWADIAAMTKQIPRAHLSRRELEHGLYACAKLDLTEIALEIMNQHQERYTDNAATLFRREMGKQFPKVGREITEGRS